MNKICCVFGHRKLKKDNRFLKRLEREAENLITEQKVDTFLFGSKSDFNSICYDVITTLKSKYPHIKRIYVRAEFPCIDESFEQYLLGKYEQSFFPKEIEGSGKAVYVERNCRMIDMSSFCIVYYNEEYKYPHRKSGTKTAFEYAKRKNKIIINIYKKEKSQVKT